MVRAQEIEGERARLRDSASQREERGEAAEAAAEREAADAPVVVIAEDVCADSSRVPASCRAALWSHAVYCARRDTHSRDALVPVCSCQQRAFLLCS